ncbi:MAG: helix-turn-helix domain-containing protein [Candidatus Sumerlaeaceae bacterium]
MTKHRTAEERFSAEIEKLKSSGEYALFAAQDDFAQQIVSRMQQLGITKKQLAEKLGTSQAYVSKILMGGANFTIESQVKIASALGCKLVSKLVAQEEQQKIASRYGRRGTETEHRLRSSS